MKDRAMQALYLLALEPIAETAADPNSYGFRPKRSTADALQQCFNVLCRACSPQWVLEGDIKGCFDHISHEWMLQHEGKLSRPVLRGGSGGNAAPLPDQFTDANFYFRTAFGM